MRPAGGAGGACGAFASRPATTVPLLPRQPAPPGPPLPRSLPPARTAVRPRRRRPQATAGRTGAEHLPPRRPPSRREGQGRAPAPPSRGQRPRRQRVPRGPTAQLRPPRRRSLAARGARAQTDGLPARRRTASSAGLHLADAESAVPGTGPRPRPGRGTFEDSMIHEELWVARRITAGCALHRCLSRGVLHDDSLGRGCAAARSQRGPAASRRAAGRGPRLRAAPAHSKTRRYTQQTPAPRAVSGRPLPLPLRRAGVLGGGRRRYVTAGRTSTRAAGPADGARTRQTVLGTSERDTPRPHGAHGAAQGGRPRAAGRMILLQVLLQKPCYDFSFL